MLHRDVAPGVHRIEDSFVNWYLVEDEGALTIVDAGLPCSWRSLHDALRELGRTPADVRGVLLTHAHFDHIGFAERARVELGLDVWVHDNDVPLARNPRFYARERSPLRYLLRPGVLNTTWEVLRTRALAVKAVREVRRYQDGPLDLPGRPEVVFTPGHTLGHVALHLPGRDTLIAGDAIVTHNPYTDERGPQIVARAATADSERALRSLDAIEQTGAGTLLPGHGEPWRGGAAEAARLARHAGPS